MTDPQNDTPLEDCSQLVSVFSDAEKPSGEFRIGAEAEKTGVFEDGARPLRYAGRHGVLEILNGLAERYGWRPEAEKEGGPILALLRGGASITLEPAGQLELSGAPLPDVHAIAAESDLHLRELTSVTDRMGIAWLGLGFHPFARRDELDLVPKGRYGIMTRYLPTRGGHALDMMLRTCTVQANFDYASEDDAMRKLRVALKLSPLTTAMFANSPWVEGRPYGGLTYRGRVWLDVDPDRTGLLPSLWKEDSGYADYAEWALDAPMFLFKRGSEIIANTGQTFRRFLEDGWQGHRATIGDWQLHLNTLFPEVRLKKTIEIRGADMQGVATLSALPALWTGILYDGTALSEAEHLVRDYRHEELSSLRERLHEQGLRAEFRGKPLSDLAAAVLDIALGGLRRRARKDQAGRDETVYLEAMRALVHAGKTPADLLVDGVPDGASFARAVVARCRLAAAG